MSDPDPAPDPDPEASGDLSGLTIERATAEDVPRLVELQHRAFRTEADLYGEHIVPYNETVAEVMEALGKCDIWKATIGGQIVGQIRGHVDERGVCQVGRLSVAPEWRRRGIARRLMATLHAAYPDCVAFELFTGHLSLGNQALYRSMGYVETERKPMDDIVLVCMRRPGSAPCGSPGK